MKLYKIREWSVRYENAQSRKCEQLHWVPIPARHDAERYCELMARPDAAEIFAAWIICLQVGARSHPRGSLVRSDGSPHTPETLAIKTRGHQEWFEKALPYLSQVGWLECVTNETHSTTSQLPVSSESGGEERREGMEGIEQASTISQPSIYGFSTFWELYPKSVAKATCQKIWKEFKFDKLTADKVIEGLRVQIQSKEWKEQGGKFIPNPEKWLIGERWEDKVLVESGPIFVPSSRERSGL